MTSDGRSRPATYELTIVGTLGPVLRRALEPYATTWPAPQTILRASFPECGDLVDLVKVLEARGVEITNVTAL